MPDAPPAPDPDALFGNSVSDLFRHALEATVPSPVTQPWQPPTPEHLAGMLPQYQVESLIGRGGMGAVYKGRQASLKRAVAIKLLPAELSANAEFTTRFEREAQTLASLNHQGIVAVFDSGQTVEGHLHFIMEFVDGTDLAHLMHTQRLASDQALELTLQICEALHYAHSQGVVHRDIKPANVLITRDGRAKLADFGLARPLSAMHTQLTATNAVMGTPDYMAPEQWQGKADHRTDIYALGVMLYEMLTGARPEGAFDPPSERVKVDARLDKVIFKAMRQEPDRRYQQVSELREDVHRIQLNQPPGPAQPEKDNGSPHQTRRKLAIFVSLACSVIVLGTLAAVTLRHKTSSATPGVVLPSRPAGETTTDDPSAASREHPFINHLGMKMVPVPGSSVLMCIHETRKKDYAAYADENPEVNSNWKSPMSFGLPTSTTVDHPVCSINWNEAVLFCKWLSAREGRVYRLPTDREWSLAVGIGALEPEGLSPAELAKKTIGADNWPEQGNYSDATLGEVLPFRRFLENYRDGFVNSAPVMSFKPNHLGIHDLMGNVWEFCGDWYHAGKSQRVARGQCFNDPGGAASYRAWRDEKARHESTGFRIVLDLGSRQ